MKIFIFNPFLYTGKLEKIPRNRQPLSLAYIASLLRNEHQIKLLDANAWRLSLEETVTDIKRFNPKILILTSTPFDRWQAPSHEHVRTLARNIIKTTNSLNIPYTILTGTHGTITPDWVFKKTKINYIVRGEPELTTQELVKALASHQDISQIKGISFRKKDQIIHNSDAERIKNLDELPLPAYDLLPMEKYSFTFPIIPQPFSIIISSRGCPYNCAYCLKSMMVGQYIARSPQSVVNEIKYLVDNFKIKGIYFQDWEFLIIKQRVIEICDLILKNNLQIKWGCNVRAPDINEEIIKKMKNAGCVRLHIGFETGSQKVLNTINKQITTQDLVQAIALCKKHDIQVGLYSIVNLPGETKQTIAETEKFLVDNDIKTISASNLPIPYFGTPLYKMLKEQTGREHDWEELDKYSGRIQVGQPPWLAKLYRWHYKYKYTLGNLYWLKLKFYQQLFKRII